MNTNTDPVRALIGEMTEYLDQQVDPELDVIDQWRGRLEAALASAPPSATVGVEAYLVERLGGEGYGNTRSIIDAAFYDPTKPAFWSSPEAQARHRVTPLVPALAQQPAAPEGCGACGDGCANRSGGCRLAAENPPAAPSGEAVACCNMVDYFNARACEKCRTVIEGWAFGDAAPQQPVGVDGDTVRSVAQHIANAVDYIDKVYPGAETLDAGVILRNMRRWHARLTAALAAQQQGGAE